MILIAGLILSWAQDPTPSETPTAGLGESGAPVASEEALAPVAQEPVTPEAEAKKEEAKKAKSSKQERKADAKEGGRKGGRDRKSGKNGDSHSWWGQMGEEQREQAKMRWQRYREMSPDSKAEMERRLEMLKRETEQMLLELPAEIGRASCRERV